LQAADPFEAIRLKAPRLLVLRGGKTIARTPEKVTSLFVEGRPEKLALNFVPGSIP
jgi:cytosine deaminase